MLNARGIFPAAESSATQNAIHHPRHNHGLLPHHHPLSLMPIARFLLSNLRPPPLPTSIPPYPRPRQPPPTPSLQILSNLLGMDAQIRPDYRADFAHPNPSSFSALRTSVSSCRTTARRSRPRPRLHVPAEYILPGDENHPLWGDDVYPTRMRRRLGWHTGPAGMAAVMPLLKAMVVTLARDLLPLHSAKEEKVGGEEVDLLSRDLHDVFLRHGAGFGVCWHAFRRRWQGWMAPYLETHRARVSSSSPASHGWCRLPSHRAAPEVLAWQGARGMPRGCRMGSARL